MKQERVGGRMSTVKIRFLVDDWTVKTLVFYFDTREECHNFIELLSDAMKISPEEVENEEEDS